MLQDTMPLDLLQVYEFECSVTACLARNKCASFHDILSMVYCMKTISKHRESSVQEQNIGSMMKQRRYFASDKTILLN